MLGQARLLAEVVISAPHPLETHPAVEQGAHNLQFDEIAERIEAPDPRPSAGGLDGRPNESDPIPISELMPGTSGES